MKDGVRFEDQQVQMNHYMVNKHFTNITYSLRTCIPAYMYRERGIKRQWQALSFFHEFYHSCTVMKDKKPIRAKKVMMELQL
jgi:hypothetical protein